MLPPSIRRLSSGNSKITSPPHKPHDHHPSRTLTLLKTIADWRPRTPFYYGWLILAMSAVGTYAATGSTQLVFGGVQNFIFEDTGWDRSAIAYAVTAGTWASGLITPFVGRLADRYGPRGLMPIAAVIAGLCFFAIAGMQAIWHFYAAYIVARTIASPMLVGVVPRTAAVNFFNRRRNLALGISAMARPFGGAINIQIFSLIALAASWRAAFQVQGIISLLIVIPLFLVMRRSPADIGLQPDGASTASTSRGRAPAAAASQTADRSEPDWSAGEAARTSAFWLIITAEALVILMSGTINFQIVPYLRDVGISPAIAAGALSVSSLLGSLGNPFWGWLSDIFSPRRLALITLRHLRMRRLPLRHRPRRSPQPRRRHTLRLPCRRLEHPRPHDDRPVLRQVLIRLHHRTHGTLPDRRARPRSHARLAPLPHHRRLPHHIPLRRAILHPGARLHTGNPPTQASYPSCTSC